MLCDLCVDNNHLVENFVKKTSLLHYSATAFRKEAADIIRIAEVEGLDAHANSVKVRLNRKLHR